MQVKLPILQRAPHQRSHFSFRAPTIQELHGYKFVELTRFLRCSSLQSLGEGVGSAGQLTKRQPVDALHGRLFDFFEGHESIRAQNAGGLATTRHGQLLRVDGTRFAKYLEFDFALPFSKSSLGTRAERRQISIVDLMSSRLSFEQMPWFLSSAITSPFKGDLDGE